MIFILDACSAINLLHIFKNDNELLRNIFNNYIITITDEVNNEIEKNLFDNKLEMDLVLKQNIRDIKNVLFIKSNDEEEGSHKYLKKYTEYSKTNGEFYSSALALNLNRLENDYIYFVTDDVPAKNEFNDFFQKNKIGSIITTSDFLFKYFLSNDYFVLDYLLNLKAQYFVGFKKFEFDIKILKQNATLKSKEHYILIHLEELLKKIDINKIISFQVSHKIARNIDNLIKNLKEYANNFNTNSLELLNQIDNYLNIIKEKQYYRL